MEQVHTQNEKWMKRLQQEEGWHTKETAQDAYTGQEVIEWVTKYQTAKQNETVKNIAAKFAVDVAELVSYNNKRWFGGKLRENSKLHPGTRLLVPVPPPRPGDGDSCSGDHGVKGEVVATNYVLWTVRHTDGDVVDLLATEVRAARCVGQNSFLGPSSPVPAL